MLEQSGFSRSFLKVLAIGIVTTLPACGGDDSPPPEEPSGTGNTGAGGNASTGGSTTAGGGTTADPGYACTYTAPPNPNITDFTSFTGDVSSCEWGDAQSLTGGCFLYDGDGDDAVATLSSTLADAALNVTGDVVAYAGFGFWFGPCTDASAFQGITFSVSGNLGDNQLQFQVQTSRNYPIDHNNTKGECDGDWGSGCDSNTYTYTEDMIGEEPLAVDVLWSNLTGGAPVDTLDSSELLGIQWQFNCEQGATCPLDITFDEVAFIE